AIKTEILQCVVIRIQHSFPDFRRLGAQLVPLGIPPHHGIGVMSHIRLFQWIPLIARLELDLASWVGAQCAFLSHALLNFAACPGFFSRRSTQVLLAQALFARRLGSLARRLLACAGRTFVARCRLGILAGLGRLGCSASAATATAASTATAR